MKFFNNPFLIDLSIFVMMYLIGRSYVQIINVWMLIDVLNLIAFLNIFLFAISFSFRREHCKITSVLVFANKVLFNSIMITSFLTDFPYNICSTTLLVLGKTPKASTAFFLNFAIILVNSQMKSIHLLL